MHLVLQSSVLLLLCAQYVFGGRLGSLGANLGIHNCPAKQFSLVPTLPDSFDSRVQWSDCISPIRNQGSCGGCWAFAASSVLTDRFCISSNDTIKRLLSPQDLINCDNQCQYPVIGQNCNQGCNGGYLDTAWSYFQSTGAVGDSCVSFTGSNQPCESQCDNGTALAPRFLSDQCYQLATVTDMMAEIYTLGPIESGFTVYQDFESYTSGVYIYDGTSAAVGGHAIRIIGWGYDSTQDVDYWLVANSWGSDWGENGYFQIRKGTDECGIESNALAGTAVTSGISNQYVPYPANPDGGSSSSGAERLLHGSFVSVCLCLCLLCISIIH